MDNVILHVLNRFDDVADQAGIRRDFNFQGIFNSSHGAECMYRRSNTTDALGESPGIPGIAPLQDDLDAAEHGAAAPRFGHLSAVNLNFKPQVAFDARDGIYGNLGH